MEETVRLNKFLSEKGICSRREADRLVDEGKGHGQWRVCCYGTEGKQCR